MGVLRYLFIFVLVLNLFAVYNCLEASTIIVNKYGNCEEDKKNPIHLKLNLTKIAYNKYATNGEFKLEEIIDDPIEVSDGCN